MSIPGLLENGVENTLKQSKITVSTSSDEDVAMPRAAKTVAEPSLTPVRRAKLLERVAAFYHQRFLDRPEGRQYLIKVRGLRNRALFADYRIGYADGSLQQALPQDAESLEQFRQLGVLHGRDREVMAGCVVFPLFDASGALVSLYGCRIEDGNSVYLGAETRGIWNAQAARRASRLLVTGSILDALTLVDRGMADLLPCIGQAGLNADQLALLGQCAVKGVTLCLPSGESHEEIERQLGALNVPVEIVTLPGREDLNHYLARHEIGAFQKLLPRHAPTQPVKATDCRYTAQGVILHQGSRRSVPAQQASSHRCPYLSLSQTKTSHGSSFEVHHGSRHAPGGRRSVHDCVVARTPTCADYANISRRHARNERKSAR